MSKILQLFIGLLILSCSSSKDITGYYQGENYSGISKLILNKDKSFSFKVDKAMSEDSIGGFYELTDDKIRLINLTKNSELVVINKKESSQINKIGVEFINAGYRDTLIINKHKKIEIDVFNEIKYDFNCNDDVIYKCALIEDKIELDSIKCGYDYKLRISQRGFHKIIPDTFYIKIKKNKFDFESFTLKKRKHNTIYSK